MLKNDVLKKLWPRASGSLVAAIVARAPTVLPKYDINTPLRLAHFMAQISHESGGGTITEESLNYTTAARIAAVWPSRFTPETAQDYVRNPKKLANKVYNGRMGNRPGTDDGYNYRGRGLLQLTGRESYQKLGKKIGLDLETTPSLVNNPDNALEVAAAEFKALNCLPACDDDDIRTVTKRVNGGYIGIDDRRAWLAKWKLAIPELPGDLPATEAEIEEIDKPLPRQADGELPKPKEPRAKAVAAGGSIISSVIAAAQAQTVKTAVAIIIVGVLIAIVIYLVWKKKG